MSRREHHHGLTQREFEVLGLMADGLTNDAIGRRAGLAPKTVESIVRSIFHRLDLANDGDTNRRVLAVRRFLEMVPPVPSTVPETSSALVGRRAELVELEKLLVSHRLLTITGLGGLGKTRLAVELARQLSDSRRVRFIDLATTDALSARQRVFEGFGVSLAVDRTARLLLERVLRAERTLVVIDNAEHVHDVIRDLVPLLTAVATTHVLVTSREPLQVSGEHVWRTPPLRLDDAVQLLATRLDEAGNGGVDTETVVSWSAELDGMPLAIELAATRLSALPVAAGSRGHVELRRLLHFDAAARHSSLDGVLIDSYRQLPTACRALLRTMAIFRAGFTLDTARLAAGADDRTAVDIVSRLVDSSLVEPRGGGYRMLEPVRQFAIAQTASSERATHEAVLVDWCVRFADGAGAGLLHDPLRWRPLIVADSDNVDAAFDAAVRLRRQGDALRIVRCLWPFWAGGAGLVAAHQRVEGLLATLDGSEEPTARAWAFVAAGQLAALARMHDVARQRLGEAVRVFDAEGDADGATVARFWLARPLDRLDLLERSIAEARACGNAFVEGWASLTLARDRMRAMEPVGECIELLDRVELLADIDRQPQLAHNTMLLRAEVMLQANWLGQSEYPVEAIDALLDDVEPFARQAGGTGQVTDVLSIASTNHLHHGRWAAARRTTAEQLETSSATQDPILVAEAILTAAAVREHDGHTDLARRAAVVAGPAFAEWASPLWLAFTVHPSQVVYRSATVRGQGRPASLDRLLAWAARMH